MSHFFVILVFSDVGTRFLFFTTSEPCGDMKLNETGIANLSELPTCCKKQSHKPASTWKNTYICGRIDLPFVTNPWKLPVMQFKATSSSIFSPTHTPTLVRGKNFGWSGGWICLSNRWFRYKLTPFDGSEDAIYKLTSCVYQTMTLTSVNAVLQFAHVIEFV